MRILLDTHVFLWWICDDTRLSESARRTIATLTNELFLSAASAWEIAIKAGLGRLTATEDIRELVPREMARNDIQELPVTVYHALQVADLPDHHRDPFDRILIAQAKVEGLPILTADPQLRAYDVDTIW